MKYFKYAFLLIAFVTLAAAFASAESESNVTVYFVSGKAEYMTSAGTGWQIIKVGTKLYSGNSIKTYRNASVEIAFDSRKNNVVSVNPDSHVVLKLKGKEKIELIDGEVFLLVRKLSRGSRFEIRTPTAVCGVRGTGSGAQTNGANTKISAYEHDSYAKGLNPDGSPKDDETKVPEGSQTNVEKGGGPSPLRKIGAGDYKRWDKWISDLFKRLGGSRKTKERLMKDLNKIDEKQSKIEERTDRNRRDKLDERKTSEPSRYYDEGV